MGARPESARATGAGALGAGGTGIGVGARFVASRSPIGTRPSVGKTASISLAQIDQSAPPPPTPYGDLPANLLSGQVFGVSAEGGPAKPPSSTEPVAAAAERPLRQYIPAPPAAQVGCIANGFDLDWGAPPPEYQQVPLLFLADLGAYAFDPELFGGGLRSEHARTWANWLEGRYASGWMLQPYKAPGAGPEAPWSFRWIPQRREVSCKTE